MIERQRHENGRLGAAPDIDGQPARRAVSAAACRATSGSRYAIAIGLPRVGDGAPLVTVPPGKPSQSTWYPCLGTRRDCPASPASGAARGGLRALGQGRAADEVAGLVEFHYPAQACVERGYVGAELVTVKRHPGLEPERIAGGEARRGQGRSRRPPRSARPTAARRRRADEELEAVLAGVAGPGEQRRAAGYLARVAGVVLDRGQVDARSAGRGCAAARGPWMAIRA